MIYKKKLDYTYTFGIFPTIEVLQKMPDKVRTVLLHPKTDDSEGVAEIIRLCKQHDINYDYSPKAIAKIAKKEMTMAIGVFSKFKTEIEQNESHVVLVSPSDMGNVGTIIRTMIGFGLKNLALVRPAVDIFDPRVVRSSMGAFFDLNFEYFDTFKHYEVRYDTHIKYPFVLNGKISLADSSFSKPASLIFGNEGEGLGEYFEKMDNTIRIDHTNNIDSLNLAVSVALGLYEFQKK